MLFKYKHFHHTVGAQSICIYILVRLLFCILFESIRICLLIIFSSSSVSRRKLYIYSTRGEKHTQIEKKKRENNQLKHILLDQHKTHILHTHINNNKNNNSKFVHRKMMNLKKSAQARPHNFLFFLKFLQLSDIFWLVWNTRFFANALVCVCVPFLRTFHVYQIVYNMCAIQYRWYSIFITMLKYLFTQASRDWMKLVWRTHNFGCVTTNALRSLRLIFQFGSI